MTTPKHVLTFPGALTPKQMRDLSTRWHETFDTHVAVLTDGTEFTPHSTQTDRQIYPPIPEQRISLIPFTLAIISILISVSAIVIALVAR